MPARVRARRFGRGRAVGALAVVEVVEDEGERGDDLRHARGVRSLEAELELGLLIRAQVNLPQEESNASNECTLSDEAGGMGGLRKGRMPARRAH